MKKIYVITVFLLSSLYAFSQFISPGDGTSYTFKALSEISNSGVTMESENVYAVSQNITISENDILVLDNNATVKLADLIQIIVKGNADFAPQDTALITRTGTADVATPANPKGIFLNGQTASGVFKNVRFEYAGLRSSGKKLEVSNCTFTLVNTKQANNTVDLLAGENSVTKNKFIENVGCAIGSGATSALALSFKNNYLYKNVTGEANRPQINLGAPGDNLIEIIDNIIIGKGENTKVGGIAVGNLLASSGSNDFVIQGNIVRGNRYGITTNGKMNVKIIDNEVIDNKYDANPMSGGSGIALYNRNNTQHTMVTGNHIEGNLWGITIIDSGTLDAGGEINLGRLNVPETDPKYNPGKNIFKDNGNSAALFDLYNNTAQTIYAQGNTWNVAIQDSVSIEKVITHKADDEKLGLVIFMYNQGTGLDAVNHKSIPVDYSISNNEVRIHDVVPSEIKIYAANGASLLSATNTSVLAIDKIPTGVYILKVTLGKESYFEKIVKK